MSISRNLGIFRSGIDRTILGPCFKSVPKPIELAVWGLKIDTSHLVAGPLLGNMPLLNSLGSMFHPCYPQRYHDSA